MKILVACEESGKVRDAFIAKGHDAISCDLLPTSRPGPQYKGDIFDIINDDFDMCIAFPPCTDLCVSGARWFKQKRADGRQQAAVSFFMRIVSCHIEKLCIENPVGIMSTLWCTPTQIIQPWQHGHGETKATCLWLRGLPALKPSNVVEGRKPRIHHMAPGPERSRLRSETYDGVALAMAEQWG
jgi:hypothetical protein